MKLNSQLVKPRNNGVLPVGTRVVIRSRNISTRYAGREGTIVAVNEQIFMSGKLYVEYGVNFSVKENVPKNQLANVRTDAWFVPSEMQILYVTYHLPSAPL